MTPEELQALILSDVTNALESDDFQAALGEVVTSAYAMTEGADPESFSASMTSAVENTDPDGTPEQAERIARIISLAATNHAVIAGADPDTEFEWVTMLDDDVRESHRPLHGEVRAAGQTWDVGGTPMHYPGEPVGDPEHWINCRCMLVPAVTAAGDSLVARDFDTAKRRKMAEAHTAMPDGSFPIANTDDLRNAIQAIGRAKDPEAVKRHIRKRAKALGAEGLLPESWTASGGNGELTAAPARVPVPANTHDAPGWITNPRETQRLRDYWTRGTGAAKIRWGTPGDLTRCEEHLRKYVGPQWAWGTCQNLHHVVFGFFNPESRGRKGGGEPDEVIDMIDAAFAAALTWEEPVTANHTHTINDNSFAASHTHGLAPVASGSASSPAFTVINQVVAASDPPREPPRFMPPTEWFQNPGFDAPTPLTITSDGRVLGHLAAWETCHVGFDGQCITPPHSNTNYAHFRTGEVETADGTLVAVGQITMDTGHAGKDAGPAATVAHYDNTGTGVADVTVGEDEFGIWVAGAMRPGVSEQQMYVLKATGALSGDWRRIGGNLELVAALAVNVPGFPIPRVAMAASATGLELSLVAAAVVVQDPHAIDAERIAIKVVETIEARAADKVRRARAEALLADANALRAEALMAAVR